jgi:multidrug resistance efflux pump
MDKDLRALRIDRDQKGPAEGRQKTWLWVLVAFFLGAVIATGAFRMFFLDKMAGNRTENRGEVAEVGNAGSSREKSVAMDDPEAPILIASGYIVPHHRIEVSSKIVGKISWVGVEKSDKVKKGQLLVKLDDKEYLAQLNQAESTLASAVARLAELEAGSRPEEIDRAAAELERARADSANARLEYERLQSLLESEVVSKREVDNARSRKEMAEAAVGVAEKTYRLTVIGPRVEQIESARAEVEHARASIRFWETQVKETEIRSPVDGTVLERRAEAGEMVSTSFAGGATVIALADLSDLQVELDISQSDFHNIRVDNRCVMSPMAYRDRNYRCEVFEIAPEANRQRATIQVKVQILEPDEYLRPEMDAQVTFYRPLGKLAE